MKNLKGYYFLIEKVMDLPTPKRNMIMDMYRDMLNWTSEPSRKDLVESFFNTLEMNGYIRNRQTEERENKLDQLTGE